MHHLVWETVALAAPRIHWIHCRQASIHSAVARTHKAERNESVCWLLTRVLPGCVWDWSRPTLWLLLREILRADWCLVARRLGHLGKGRHCWGRILIWVTGMGRKVQGETLAQAAIAPRYHKVKNLNHKTCVSPNIFFRSAETEWCSKRHCVFTWAIFSLDFLLIEENEHLTGNGHGRTTHAYEQENDFFIAWLETGVSFIVRYD